MSDRPNVLLITTDTQRWDSLRCMESAFAISPNLDRLASKGVLFENAHTSSPVCMPARCSLMTGVHTHVHGCIENGFDRYDHLPMLPDLLKAAGYTNIMVGKSHFGPIPDSFDVVRVTRGEKSADSNDVYAEFIRSHGYTRSSRHMEDNPVPADLFMDAFLTTTTIDQISRVVERGSQPFFAFCSLVSPHGPIDPPGHWATLYDGVDLPQINYREGEIANHPPAMRALLGYPDAPDIDREALLRLRRRYYGLASYCDHQVGRLLAFLDAAGLREDTLVIFTSDHGQQYMDHGFNNKHNWYDESWRIPLIVSQPGTLPEGERREFAIWNDLATTILAAAGTGCETMQGYDLYTPLSQGRRSPRHCAVATLFQSVAVASNRWKMEYYFQDQGGRLFDRQMDPDEQVDRFDDPAVRHIRDRLLQGLFAWYGETTDLKGLIDRSHRGGPISRRAVAHMRNSSGLAAEDHLGRICQEVDALDVA